MSSFIRLLVRAAAVVVIATSAAAQVYDYNRRVLASDIHFGSSCATGDVPIHFAARCANGGTGSQNLGFIAKAYVNNVQVDQQSMPSILVNGAPGCGGTCSFPNCNGTVLFPSSCVGLAGFNCACDGIFAMDFWWPLAAGDLVRVELLAASGTAAEINTADDTAEMMFVGSATPVPAVRAVHVGGMLLGAILVASLMIRRWARS